MNSFYNIFNSNYIQQQAKQLKEQRNIIQIQESALKLKDFLESTGKIDAEYENVASEEFSAVIFAYLQKRGMINNQ